MKVLAMLSGGVDSSVAAARLVDCGFDVTGIYMRNWSIDNISNLKVRELLKSCNSDQDEVYAKATADHLGLPFRVINFEKQYWNCVIEPFFEGIKRGEMPNPDIWCNQFIKYGVFLDWALANGADFVASGHYARLQRKFSIFNFQFPNQFQLLRGVDSSKDQSYFLSHVPLEKLRYALFPLGHLSKTQVRQEAIARGLPTASKPDSQGICFVGKVPLKEFLKERFKEKRGDIVLQDGTIIGKHIGVYFYTMGERLGNFSILNSKFILKSKVKNLKSNNDLPPLYIIEKDIKRNILVVGQDDGSYPLWQKEFRASNWNWFEAPKENILYDVEIRYHQKPRSRGKFLMIPKLKIVNCKLKIALEEPVRAVTPGQTVVLSEGDRIVGSGIIADERIHL